MNLNLLQLTFLKNVGCEMLSSLAINKVQLTFIGFLSGLAGLIWALFFIV